MARLRARIARAAALHRQAEAVAGAAGQLLHAYTPVSAAAEQHAEERTLAARLRATAARLAPGWLDAPLDALSTTTPLGSPTLPTFVRVGQAHPLDDACFPVMVPLLRAGHVAIDADARDPRVAGLLRTLVLRLLAAAPAGSVLVRIVDSAEVGATFEAFQPAPFPAAVTDQGGLRRLLAEAEQWVANRNESPTAPTLLLVIASLPELTDGSDLARISALAKAGPSGRLHIIAAGWPPPPLTAETTAVRYPDRAAQPACLGRRPARGHVRWQRGRAGPAQRAGLPRRRPTAGADRRGLRGAGHHPARAGRRGAPGADQRATGAGPVGLAGVPPVGAATGRGRASWRGRRSRGRGGGGRALRSRRWRCGSGRSR